MSIRTSLAMVKLAAVVFASATIVFSVKYYESQKQNQKLKESNRLDKNMYVNELKEIFDRYDAEVLENNKLHQIEANYSQNSVLIEKNNLKKIQSSLDDAKLASDKAFVFKIDSLKLVLKKQMEENKLLANQISILNNRNKDAQRQNATNKTVSAPVIPRKLEINNVYANGIKNSSNNIVETSRFGNTEQIRVCFTVLDNKEVVKGNKDVFIQVINPMHKILSKNGNFIEQGDKTLYYSAKTNVFYENEKLDVCVFVDSNKNDIQKGNYQINIFSGTNLIGNTSFSLK